LTRIVVDDDDEEAEVENNDEANELIGNLALNREFLFCLLLKLRNFGAVKLLLVKLRLVDVVEDKFKDDEEQAVFVGLTIVVVGKRNVICVFEMIEAGKFCEDSVVERFFSFSSSSPAVFLSDLLARDCFFFSNDDTKDDEGDE